MLRRSDQLPGSSGFGRLPWLTPWLGRALLAIGSPLLVLGLAEGLLRLAGYGVSPHFFLPEPEPGLFRTNRNFTAPYVPAGFGLHPVSFRLTKRKPADSLRIFVLGESAALGDPNPSFGLSEQLRTLLAARYPERKIEIYNLGIVAINSHVVLQIARDVAGFEPDLLVFYMGNNEVVGPNGPGCFYAATMPPLAIIRAGFWVRRTRLGQWLAARLGWLRGDARKSQAWRGMELFQQQAVRGSDPRLETVCSTFESNLRGCVEAASAAGARVVLATVVANYADFAPFRSLHRADFPPDRLRGFDDAFAAGLLAWAQGDRERAVSAFTDLLAWDHEFANTLYVLGKLEQERGNIAAARRHFADAVHWDALRFRPDAPINQVIRRVAREHPDTVTLVDAAREMGGDPDSSGELSGRNILFEHVHFNWEGNYRLARRVAESCVEALALPRDRAVPWLDSQQCATKLGFTEFEAMQTDVRVFQQMSRPPFANRLFFGEELAKLKREIDFSRQRLAAAGGAVAALEDEARALQNQPPGAERATRRAVVAFNLGHNEEALELIEQARALVPESPYLFVELRAAILQSLHRETEAEQLLLAAVRPDPGYAPGRAALVDYWIRTGQWKKGRQCLEPWMAKCPGDAQLRLDLARLLQSAGNLPAAAAESLAVLRQDPGNETALEETVEIYRVQGRESAAITLMEEARRSQPCNSRNLQRLAAYFESRHDLSGAQDSLQTMADFTPVDAAFHLDLARQYAALDRQPELLRELGRAKRMAEIEENHALVAAIDNLLHDYASAPKGPGAR